MVEENILVEKMKERGFDSWMSKLSPSADAVTEITFMSDNVYDMHRDKPVIQVIVTLETGEFRCFYSLNNSLNSLQSGKCSPVMSDEHFYKIVSRFWVEAEWLTKLTA